MKLKNTTAFIVVIALLGAALVLALTNGQYHIDTATLWKLIMLKLGGIQADGDMAAPSTVLWSVRLPRTLMAVITGAALAVGGVVFQGMMRNPLVSPSFLGISHGAVFGASIALIFLSKSALVVEGSAFVWALIAVALVYAIGNRGINTLTTLVIAGVIISSFFMAAGAFLKYIADPYEELPAITFWAMGGLNNVLWPNVARAFSIISVGLLAVYLLRWRLNLLAIGDEDAVSMGLNIKVVRGMFMLFGTLMVAAASSSCGIIMWVDLIVAHISRMIIGPDHRNLIPFAALMGAVFLLLTDTLVRLLPGGEIPISIVTSFAGAPLLGYLLIKQNNEWKY
ncbi:MAG: iron ABC transporter permease [Spirochaetia bacterium]|jgi:iron complex transport system permease protein|nr:iron ABC transporter permease [Spirochaetia bacterium]